MKYIFLFVEIKWKKRNMGEFILNIRWLGNNSNTSMRKSGVMNSMAYAIYFLKKIR